MKPLQYKKNIIPGICAALNCRRKSEGRKLCSTCRSRKIRFEDPERYAFNNLKNNAERRGVIFTITLEQFRDWCSKVQYIGFAGRSSESFTIDRKYNDVGYHIDNIQVMEKGKNVKKYFSYDYRSKTVVFSVRPKEESIEKDYF